MIKRARTRTITAFALFAVVGLVSALAPSIASLNLARAHSPGGATLAALTVAAGTAVQTLSPTFSSTVYSYRVHMAYSVGHVTTAGTPDGDGTVAYQNTDGTTLTDADTVADGQQVDLPAVGAKRVNVVVSHTDSGAKTTQTYSVLVIREGTVATDRAALMALYNSTDGGNWTNNTNWGSSKPLGTWDRVTTDSDGRVTFLTPWQNNLNGTLPAELGNLDKLAILYLYNNQLRGTVPYSLGHLANVRHLYLNSNALRGTIPNALGSLSSVQILTLAGNQMTGEIPDSLGNLTNLRYLNLGGNHLSGTIPASVGNIASLQRLWLWSNDFEGPLPTSLGNLSNLQTLDISGNNFDGPIPDLSRLTKLQWVYLWDNQLSGEIPDLSNLTSLEELYLNRNDLSGTIPDLSRLTGLKHLDLSYNQLSGEIPTLSRLTKLHWL